MTKIPGIYRVAGILLIFLFAVTGYAQLCSEWKSAVRVGELQNQLKEASGVSASRKFAGRLYHINDSGDTGKFYVTAMDGKDTLAVAVAGFKPVDVEALSLGPCPTGSSRNSCIYIADIGDNDIRRKSISVVVVNEQTFSPTVNAVAQLQLHYPDGPHDAESFAVHPDGTFYILTKERPARLFKGSPRLTAQTLTFVATLDPGGKPTDIAISDDGMRLLVLTYTDAVEYSIDLKSQHKIPLEFLQQQESVAYLPGSRSFIYTTEQLLPTLPQWIMHVDCAKN
jgi:hypothetical protein